MVHVDAERESQSRTQFAIGLADYYDAALIGVAGLAPRPAFAAGNLVVFAEPDPRELGQMTARFDDMGKKFLAEGRDLKQVEWRSALEPPSDLLVREARAADLIIVAPRNATGRYDFFDAGAVLLRAGRPVMVVPETVTSLDLHCAVIAWKDTRECRRAVRDALPLLRRAKQVLVVAIGEDETESQAKRALSDVTAYLVRHQVIVAGEIRRRTKGSTATELLQLVKSENADLIVAGGYGHSRMGEWIFGGVTHTLLATSPVCCMLSH
jgi:nucleotide-binding universal stress UspA family protein